MMKLLILAACIYAGNAAVWKAQLTPVASVHAVGDAKAVVKSASEAEIPIIRFDSDVGPEGFNYAYETGNGIAAEATASLKKVEEVDVLSIKGAYKYTSPDGTPVEVTYVADENGYQPQSDLLPVGPPVPEAIARALEYIASHPSAESKPKA